MGIGGTGSGGGGGGGGTLERVLDLLGVVLVVGVGGVGGADNTGTILIGGGLQESGSGMNMGTSDRDGVGIVVVVVTVFMAGFQVDRIPTWFPAKMKNKPKGYLQYVHNVHKQRHGKWLTLYTYHVI